MIFSNNHSSKFIICTVSGISSKDLSRPHCKLWQPENFCVAAWQFVIELMIYCFEIRTQRSILSK